MAQPPALLQTMNGRSPGAALLPLHFEFATPATKQLPSTRISPTRSPWDAYQKRKEIIEYHPVDFITIMRMVQSDGYVRSAVAKYVNSIFLRGYNNYTLKKEIDKYIKLRLQMIIDANPEHNHIDDLYQAIAKDLVAYANVYILKVRAKQPPSSIPNGVKSFKGIPYLKPNGKKEPQDPIATYELLHPATIHIIRDDNGNVLRLEQWPMGVRVQPQDKKQIRTWQPQEIIHIAMDREDGYPYGTPALDAIIDDVRLLRTLEDNASRLAFRYAFPFTQVKIGDTKPGFAASEEEIAFYRQLVQNAPPDATLVTNEKVSFDVVGVQGQAIDLKPYLEHFEARLFSGLQISEVSMGRGDTANRSTADAMSVEMHDQIKHYQNIFARNISQEIYRELLLEAGYDWYADPEKNFCNLMFEEIEIESMITQEQHVLAMVQGGLLSISEGRIRNGEQPYTDAQWKDSYLYKWLLPQDTVKVTGMVDLDDHGDIMKESHDAEIANVQADTDAKNAATKAAAENPPDGPSETTTAHHTVTTGGGKKIVKRTIQTQRPAGPSTGAASGKTGRPAGPSSTLRGTTFALKPANQHGQRSGPKRKTEDTHLFGENTTVLGPDIIDFRVKSEQYEEELKDLYNDMKLATLEQVRAHIESGSSERPPMLEFLYQVVEMRLKTLSTRYLLPAFSLGWSALEKDTGRSLPLPVSFERSALEDFNAKTMKRLIGDINRNVNRLINRESDAQDLYSRISGVFAVLEYRLGFIANSELPQAFWYGYATAAAAQGRKVQFLCLEENPCTDCMELQTLELLSPNASPAARLAAVPPRHVNCDCSLSVIEDTPAA